MVTIVDRVDSWTVKTQLLATKTCRLDFIFRTQGKFLRKVQLNIFAIISRLHFREDTWHIVHVCSMFQISVTGIQNLLTYIFNWFFVINSSNSLVLTGWSNFLCIRFFNMLIPVVYIYVFFCWLIELSALSFSRYLVSDSCGLRFSDVRYQYTAFKSKCGFWQLMHTQLCFPFHLVQRSKRVWSWKK